MMPLMAVGHNVERSHEYGNVVYLYQDVLPRFRKNNQTDCTGYKVLAFII